MGSLADLLVQAALIAPGAALLAPSQQPGLGAALNGKHALDAVSDLLGLDPRLLRRVDAGTQAMPIDIAHAIAKMIGVDFGTLAAASQSLTTATTSSATATPRQDSIVRVAGPARLKKTAAVPPPPGRQFTPRDFPDLWGWVDTSDVTTTWQNTSGFIPVAVNGDALQRSDNKADVSYFGDMRIVEGIVPSLWTQPILGSGLGGMSEIFDNDHRGLFATMLLDVPQPLTIWLAAKSLITVDFPINPRTEILFGGGCQLIHQYDGQYRPKMDAGGAGFVLLGDWLIDDCVLCCVFNSDGSKFYANGHAEFATGNPGANGILATELIAWGCGSDASFQFDGQLPEWFGVRHAATETEAMQGMKYLSQKYGTPFV